MTLSLNLPTTLPKRLAACMTAALCLSLPPAAFAADSLPGGGKTIRIALSDSLGANYIQDQILIAAFKELGYKIADRTLGSAAIMQGIALGDLDVTADVVLPQTMPAYRKIEDKAALVGPGSITGGGINGYLIDKTTAEAHGITSFEQLKDPALAKLFDTDGDGKADLMNCDPGWSCGDVVDFQIQTYGLVDTVRSVRAKYEPLMAETFARAKRGEPVLYYTWSPSWVSDALNPGKDVVWLPVPFDALPPGVTSDGGQLIDGVVGCAGGQDPCRMAVGVWNWRIVANRAFLAENPAAEKLLAAVNWPGETWSQWEATLNKHKSDREIRRIAEDWIAANRATFDGWIAAAKE